MKQLFTLTMAVLFLSGMSLMAKPGEGKRGEGKRGPAAEGKKGEHSAKRAEMREKIKNMTEEERKAFFAKMKEKHGKKGKCKKGSKGKTPDKA